MVDKLLTQASTLRTALLWVITQQVVNFGTAY